MVVQALKNPSDCGSQKGKAKSRKGRLVAKLARFVRKAGLSYNDWRYVSRRVRQKCDLRPAAKPKKLPRVLTADQFSAFYKAVDEADDVQHALMLRLLFYTGVRVSELCAIEVSHVDLENCKVFIDQGKGSKDRYVLFGRSFATALRTHISCASPEPMVVPDEAVRAVQHQAGRADREAVRRTGWRSCDPALISSSVHDFLDEELRSGGCRDPAHYRARSP